VERENVDEPPKIKPVKEKMAMADGRDPCRYNFT
jgi:hypothetical protein